MKTGYKTSKAPYEDIHFGDFIERYKGAGLEKVVWRPFGVKLKPGKSQRAYPILKVERIVFKNPYVKRTNS
jgi:hypothetical protein